MRVVASGLLGVIALAACGGDPPTTVDTVVAFHASGATRALRHGGVSTPLALTVHLADGTAVPIPWSAFTGDRAAVGDLAVTVSLTADALRWSVSAVMPVRGVELTLGDLPTAVGARVIVDGSQSWSFAGALEVPAGQALPTGPQGRPRFPETLGDPLADAAHTSVFHGEVAGAFSLCVDDGDGRNTRWGAVTFERPGDGLRVRVFDGLLADDATRAPASDGRHLRAGRITVARAHPRETVRVRTIPRGDPAHPAALPARLVELEHPLRPRHRRGPRPTGHRHGRLRPRGEARHRRRRVGGALGRLAPLHGLRRQRRGRRAGAPRAGLHPGPLARALRGRPGFHVGGAAPGMVPATARRRPAARRPRARSVLRDPRRDAPRGAGAPHVTLSRPARRRGGPLQDRLPLRRRAPRPARGLHRHRAPGLHPGAPGHRRGRGRRAHQRLRRGAGAHAPVGSIRARGGRQHLRARDPGVGIGDRPRAQPLCAGVGRRPRRDPRPRPARDPRAPPRRGPRLSGRGRDDRRLRLRRRPHGALERPPRALPRGVVHGAARRPPGEPRAPAGRERFTGTNAPALAPRGPRGGLSRGAAGAHAVGLRAHHPERSEVGAAAW